MINRLENIEGRKLIYGERVHCSCYNFKKSALISRVMTRFDKWLIMRASTLLALTSWCSANRGTSQNASALFDSYSGFSFNDEYQGSTESTRPTCKSRRKGSSGLHYVG